MPVVSGDRKEEHSLNDRDFKFICRLVYDHTGIVLGDNKRDMLYRRIMRRVRGLKLSSFTEYCELLKADHAHDELDNFINAVTTNLTSFFREKHHFDYLKGTFLPELIEKGNSRRLRIWSAGCSTGEEPYSIAMTLQQSMGASLANWDAKILATDLDTEVLATGKAGIYSIDKLGDIDPEKLRKSFRKGVGERASEVKANPQLQRLITFKPLNLLGEWPMKGPFDVIFCRNVMIYFDRETQNNLIARFNDLLKPGGLLLIGHSENLGIYAEEFDSLGKTIFRKREDRAINSGG